MLRHTLFALSCVFALGAVYEPSTAEAQQAYGRSWGGSMTTTDWDRYYHYPYVYYPQNFYGPEYMKSSNDKYFRYPQEMRIPVYNKGWMNYYPSARRYYQGSHFNLDVF